MDPLFLHFAREAGEEQRRCQLRLERIILRDEQNAFELPETEFRRCFRLSKDLVQELIRLLIPHMAEGVKATRIPIQIRMLAALRFFAHGSYQRAAGNEVNVSIAQPFISRGLAEVCLALEAIAPQWVRFPLTQAEKQNKKEQCMAAFGFPGVIGCVDGTHVAIVPPHKNEHIYFNRKRYHSKNVQIICDSNLLILNINPNFGGATHDAFIWRNSHVKTHLEQNYNQGDHNSWLLGNSGYPQEPWLMTPIRDVPQDSPEGRYTSRLTRTRNCMERCIGVLKNRFRCLLKNRVLYYHPLKAGQIINAISALHNMCVMANLPVDEEQYEYDDVNDLLYEEILPAGNVLQEGQKRRANLIELYFSLK